MQQHCLHEIKDKLKVRLERELYKELKKNYLEDCEKYFINNFVENHQQDFYDLLFKQDDENSSRVGETEEEENII